MPRTRLSGIRVRTRVPNRPGSALVAQVSPPAVSADFPVGSAGGIERPAGLEARDTADLEICATTELDPPPG